MADDGTVPVRQPREELRLAVVLNGGVSLAVWIGGVTVEIDRLTRGEDAYGLLLDLIDSTARADVITGTSAGGINGAALALAQVNPKADLRILRDVWAEQGRMEALLRTPFTGSPASLLRGDEFFLPKLNDALSGLAADFTPVSADWRPVHLGITTTLLRGGRKVVSDSLGQALPQAVHAGLLTFRHLPADAAGTDQSPADDDFSPSGIETTVRRLALAARSSAGFPVAFEPSFLPAVDSSPDAKARPDGRPDMRSAANWFDASDTGDQSRFAVDGGVLANTPTTRAIDAIEDLPSQGLVRRMMLLVYPHAPLDAVVEPQAQDEPPTVVEALRQMFGAMRNEAGRTHIDAVEKHNRLAANKRGGRVDVLVSLWRDAGDQAGIGELVDRLNQQLYSHYRNLRIRRSARDLADRVRPVEGWPYDRVLQAAQLAQCEADQAAADTPAPAAVTPPLESAPDTPLRAALPYIWDDAGWQRAEHPHDTWPWGLTTAMHVLDDVLDLVKRLCWTDQPDDDIGRLRAAQETLSNVRTSLRRTRRELDALWTRRELADIELNVDYWKLRLKSYRAAYLDGPTLEVADFEPLRPRRTRTERDDARWAADIAGFVERHRALVRGGGTHPAAGYQSPGAAAQQAMTDVADQVEALRDIIRRVAALEVEGQARGAGSAVCNSDGDVIAAWNGLIGDLRGDALITRLVRLEVVTSCLTNGPEDSSEQIIEITQISLQTVNAFQHYTKAGIDKLGGNRLGHFAGFLKESWRVNDWIWGRLDAATMLCRVALDPQRVRRTLKPDVPAAATLAERETMANDLMTKLLADLYPSNAIPSFVEAKRDDALQELVDHVFVHAPDDQPATLTNLADVFALSLQLKIAAEEVPALANAIASDQRDGALGNTAGARFVADNQSLIAQLKALPEAGRGRIPIPTGPPPAAPPPAPPAVPSGPDPADGTRLALGEKALAAFDRAGVGREPLNQEAASDQMIRTGASAMAVGVTMLDSPHLGIKAVKPFTRTLRGLALTPYWLARGLAGGGQIARALSLGGLAVGAALLGLSLLTDTPTWLTVFGLSALLAGVGYSALRTGSLVHGLVLCVPVIPLTAYALTSRVDSGDQQNAPVIVFMALLIAGLYVLGSIGGLIRSPVSVFVDLWRDRKRRWRAIVAWVAAVVLVVAAVIWRDWLADRWDAIGDYLDRHPLPSYPFDHHEWTWLVWTGGVLALLSIAAAHFGARKFQVWYWAKRGDDTEVRLHWRRTSTPSAVAAAWSCVYAWLGVAIVYVSLKVVHDKGYDLTPPLNRPAGNGDAWTRDWTVTAFVWSVGIATVLLFAAVVWLPFREERRFKKLIEQQVRSGVFTVAGPDRLITTESARGALRERLKGSGNTYRYLLKQSPTEPHDVVLTRWKGERLADRLERIAPRG